LQELEKITVDFEREADLLIDKYLAEKTTQQDFVDLAEKKLILKELAMASKKSEIVKKLNGIRESKNLPIIQPNFDLFYYQQEYAPLVESLSLHYAQNLAKKFRFASRITRVAKLHEIAEDVLDRIRQRDEFGIKAKEEKLHNENIKIFAQLLSAIDEQMGKLKITKIDIGVRSNEKPILETAEGVKKFITEALENRFRDQLPSSVDANFTEITDYSKCEFNEKMGEVAHCWYFNEQCKVQTNEISKCPHFCNGILLHNKEYMDKCWRQNKLSVRQIAELTGCKDVDEKVIERVRNRLRDHQLSRDTAGDN
jgi:hypothetical protein